MPLFKSTLGILGGMGLRATVNFLNLLTKEINAIGITEDSEFPHIIMLSIPLQEWGILGSIDKAHVSKQVNDGLKWLRAAGADYIAVPCNTVHEFITDHHVISIIDETLLQCGGGTLGVLCSHQTRQSKLYEKNRHRVKYYHNQNKIDGLIEAVQYGRNPEIGPLINAEFSDCSQIILGCTELSLCTIHWNDERNILDSTAILAKAAVKRLTQ